MRGFLPGDVVQGLFLDGEWYLATVQQRLNSGTYMVEWFDGDDSCRERRADQLRLMRFSKELDLYEEDAEDAEERAKERRVDEVESEAVKQREAEGQQAKLRRALEMEFEDLESEEEEEDDEDEEGEDLEKEEEKEEALEQPEEAKADEAEAVKAKEPEEEREGAEEGPLIHEEEVAPSPHMKEIDIYQAARIGDVWRVVGGHSSGGIVVRAGRSLSGPSSQKLQERLATGSLVYCLLRDGDRMQYELLSGSGPPHGWVSIGAEGRLLLVLVAKKQPRNGSRPEHPRDTDTQVQQGPEMSQKQTQQEPEPALDPSMSELAEKGVLYEVKVRFFCVRKKPWDQAAELTPSLVAGERVALAEWDSTRRWRVCWFWVSDAVLGQGWARMVDEDGWPQLWPRDPRHGAYEMPRALYSLRPLCLAVYENNLVHLGSCLSDGHAPNARDGGSKSALMHAARWGRLECCVWLAKAGADAKLTSHEGLNAIDFAKTAPLKALLKAMFAEEFQRHDFDAALEQLSPEARKVAQDIAKQVELQRNSRKERDRERAKVREREMQLLSAQKAALAEEGKRLAAEEYRRQQRCKQDRRIASDAAVATAWLEAAQERLMQDYQASWDAQVESQKEKREQDVSQEAAAAERRAAYFRAAAAEQWSKH